MVPIKYLQYQKEGWSLARANINETIRLIQRQGFTFTVSDLARGLAISKRTIYEHFSSKEEIVEYIIDGMIRHIQQREREIAADETLTVLEKIHQILICLPQEMEKMDLGMLPDLKRSHYPQWEKLDTFSEKNGALSPS